MKLLNHLLNKRWILNIVMRFLNSQTREHIHIAIIRNELTMWGYDMSDFTDHQIKDGVVHLYEVHKIGQMGVNAAQAGQALRNVFKLMQ